jgi:hypothetical protein
MKCAISICREMAVMQRPSPLRYREPAAPNCVNWYRILSDIVLAIHAGFVGFVVFGLVAIWVGWWRGWPFVRSKPFRLVHLLAMGIVLIETCAGLVCPLTAWEDQLRRLAGEAARPEASFMQRWLGSLLFYEASETVFLILYAAFFAMMVLTYWLVPPGPARPMPRDRG